MKTLRDALKCKLLQESSLCQLACTVSSLAIPQFPLCVKVEVTDIVLVLSLVTVSCPFPSLPVSGSNEAG